MNLSFENAGLEDIVRARAYALWESEGRPIGRDAEHWRLSEQETLRALAEGEAPPAPPKPKTAAKAKSTETKKSPKKAKN
jgi:hypothetical protein